jgi:Ser/Thr protein kinase RdoA (MazF antagonist)
MDGQLVEPDWPPLVFAELRALLRQFPASGEPLQILSASPRPFSSASVVHTAQGRVFLKRHHRSVRDRHGLLEEHRFLAHLFAHGAPVPRVLRSANGESVLETEEWIYEVHEAAAGFDLYQNAISWTPFRSATHAAAAGRALARLHQASQGFNAPRRHVQPLVAGFTIFAASDPAAEMERYLAARPSLAVHSGVRACAAEALELLAPFHAELAPMLPTIEPLWTHNDLHASNLFWSNEADQAEVSSIIDFGLSDRTNSVHDLAQAIERNIVGWLALVEDPTRPEQVPVHLDHLEALLTGYDSVLPLSEEQARALGPMSALCHAEFALSEADYFLGVLGAPDRAPLAYDGWLVGHARWFCGGGGRRLLDGLKRWADARAGARR